ncbi:unnamed protein product [Chrysoparadoxa australica]
MTPESLLCIKKRGVDLYDSSVRSELRKLWDEGHLLLPTPLMMDTLRHSPQQLDPMSSFMDVLQIYIETIKARRSETQEREELMAFLWEQFPGDLELYFAEDTRDEAATIMQLQHLCEWFRQEFPYYYGVCGRCNSPDTSSFVGFISSSPQERKFKASRTELYYCKTCQAVTHFPRFGLTSKVLETRRGRCGEYTAVMLRFLEGLGYRCKWVVNRGGHMWCEAMVKGRWVHVDPCEASVDDNQLYERWGRDLTYVLGFTRSEVQDVTSSYTSNFEKAKERRDLCEQEMTELLAKATQLLREPTVEEVAAMPDLAGG